MADNGERVEEAEVVWEGNSLEVVRTFPKRIREDLGADIRRLQLGERPLSSRPMPSIGRRVPPGTARTNVAVYAPAQGWIEEVDGLGILSRTSERSAVRPRQPEQRACVHGQSPVR